MRSLLRTSLTLPLLRSLLLGSAFLSVTACTTAQTKKATAAVRKQITELSVASSENQDSCEKYVSELETGSGLKGRPSERLFKDRKVALVVLLKLESHPLTPKATQEVNRLILDSDPAALNFPSFADNLSVVQGFCGTVPSYVNFTRLVTGKEKFKWTSAEIDRVKKVGLRWIQVESSFPGSLLSTRVAVSVLETMNDAGILANENIDREMLRQKIEPLKASVARLTADLRVKESRLKPSASPTSRNANTAARLKVYEIEKATEIREELRRLYLDLVSTT